MEHYPEAAELAAELRALRELLGRPDPLFYPRVGRAGLEPLYISRDDRLFVQASQWTSGTREVTIRARLLLPTGKIQWLAWIMQLPATGRFIETFELAEGVLLGLNVSINGGGLDPGRCFVHVSLCRGTAGQEQVHQTLLQGYPTGSIPLGWPQGPQNQPGTVPGALTTFVSSNPAAGSELSVTVPTDEMWRVQSLVFTFAAIGGVPNRTVNLILDDGVEIFYRQASPFAQGPGVTTIHCAISGGERLTVADTTAHFGLPANLWLLAGMRIRTLTTNLQAADDFSAMVIGLTRQTMCS